MASNVTNAMIKSFLPQITSKITMLENQLESSNRQLSMLNDKVNAEASLSSVQKDLLTDIK